MTLNSLLKLSHWRVNKEEMFYYFAGRFPFKRDNTVVKLFWFHTNFDHITTKFFKNKNGK